MSTLVAEALAGIGPARGGEDAASAANAAGPGRYRYLLLLRFAVVNAVGMAMLAAAWLEGWVDPIVATDSTRLCLLIFAVFLLGLALTAEKAAMLSRELNELTVARAGGPPGPPRT